MINTALIRRNFNLGYMKTSHWIETQLRRAHADFQPLDAPLPHVRVNASWAMGTSPCAMS
jgi:hypothetical protein